MNNEDLPEEIVLAPTVAITVSTARYIIGQIRHFWRVASGRDLHQSDEITEGGVLNGMLPHDPVYGWAMQTLMFLRFLEGILDFELNELEGD